jgi:hypothetical protein
MGAVPTDEETTAAERTTAAMHATADELEVAEAILHHSAERSPDVDTTIRLHTLGDQVTAQAHDIARRADQVTDEPHQAERPDSATRKGRWATPAADG